MCFRLIFDIASSFSRSWQDDFSTPLVTLLISVSVESAFRIFSDHFRVHEAFIDGPQGGDEGGIGVDIILLGFLRGCFLSVIGFQPSF